MFGLGHAPELILVLVIALIFLGPGKIPEVAQLLGKGIRELRQASADLQKTFDVNELVNPPAPPPPAEPPVAPSSGTVAASTETIASAVLMDTAAKPKRARKKNPIENDGASPVSNSDTPDKPRTRRRSSKKNTEPVSLDAAV